MLTVAHRIENGGKGEDRLLVERYGTRTLAIVADGAGGMGGGAAAAAMACSIAAQKLRTGGAATPEDWARCLYEADQAVVRTGGQCTAVVVEISEGRVIGASVGDSGAWLLTGKAIVSPSRNVARILRFFGAADRASAAPSKRIGLRLVRADQVLHRGQQAVG